MLKKSRKKLFHWFFGAVVLCFLSGGKGTTVYANTGEIKIALEDLQTSGSDWEDVEILLYRVGDVSEEGIPTLDVSYGLGEYPEDYASLEKTAKTLAGMMTEEPLKTTRTDESGIAYFWGIDRGVYLVVIPSDNHYGVVKPFMVPVPYLTEVEGEEKLQYAVEAEPKASPHKSTPPGEDNPGKHKHKGGGGDSTQSLQPAAAVSPQTGDTAPVELYLMLGAGALVVLLAFIIYRRKRS